MRANSEKVKSIGSIYTEPSVCGVYRSKEREEENCYLLPDNELFAFVL